MLNLNQLIGFGAGCKMPVPTVSFLASYEDGATASSYTFAASNLGTANTKRRIIVHVACENTAATVATVVVGGVFATRVAVASADGIQANSIWVAALDESVGATGDIILNPANGQPTGLAISVYVSYDLQTNRATDSSLSVASPGALSLTVTEPGFVVAGIWANASAASVTWSGLTEDVDSQIGTDAARIGSASSNFSGYGTRSITATYAAGTAWKAESVLLTNLPAERGYCWIEHGEVGSDNAAASTTRTQAGRFFGPAYEGRLIVCTILFKASSGDPTITSATIGGVAATVAAETVRTASVGVAVFYAIVPTGTTGDIVVNFSANVSTGRIAQHIVKGYTSSVPFDAGFASAASSTASCTVDVKEGGVSIGASADGASSTITPSSVTGCQVLSSGNSGGLDLAEFFHNADATELNRTMSMVWNSASSVIAVASWR